MNKNSGFIFAQGLHIHTTYSSGDGAVVPEQTIEFVISSDAHQPSMLAQNVALFAAQELGIREKILFLK